VSGVDWSWGEELGPFGVQVAANRTPTGSGDGGDVR
jgi:hypothetical protein